MLSIALVYTTQPLNTVLGNLYYGDGVAVAIASKTDIRYQVREVAIRGGIPSWHTYVRL